MTSLRVVTVCVFILLALLPFGKGEAQRHLESPTRVFSNLAVDPPPNAKGRHVRARRMSTDISRIQRWGERLGSDMEFNLFEDVKLAAVSESADSSLSVLTITGRLRGPKEGWVVVSMKGNLVSGVLAPDGHLHYSIDGHVDSLTVREYDGRSAPRPGQTSESVDGSSLEGDRITLTATPETTPTIDLLVLYTPEAVNLVPNIESSIITDVTLASSINERSGVFFDVNIVHMQEVNYREQKRIIDDLNNLEAGYVPQAHQLRETYDADVVALFMSCSEPGCGVSPWVQGMARLMEDVNTSFEDEAFFAVSIDDSGEYPYWLLAHELGHVMGCQHDWATDSDAGVYEFSHGYVNEHSFYTVMAYPDDCHLGVNEKGDRFGAAVDVVEINPGHFCPTRVIVGAPKEKPGDSKRSGAAYIYSCAIRGYNLSNGDVQAFQALTQDGIAGIGTNEAGDEFGYALASGDFDGDGVQDIVVGAPGEKPGDGPRAGGVKIILGSTGGMTEGFSINQGTASGLGRNERGDSFGTSLAVGDFNGDGHDDLAIGAPGESPGSAPRSGGVKLFYGGSAGEWLKVGTLNQETEPALGKNERGDLFGWSLVAAGFDDDGYSDLVVGAPGESPAGDPQSGAVYVFRGSEDGLTPFKAIHQESYSGMGSNERGDEFGYSLAAGDFNGDAVIDLAVGAPGEKPGSGPRSGGVKIFQGPDLTGWHTINQETQSGLGTNEKGDRFGHCLAVGDFGAPIDPDTGTDDLAVGTPGETTSNGAKAGAVKIFRGSSSGLVPFIGINQGKLGSANEAGDEFGFALAVGDLDMDGLDDLVIGAPGKRPEVEEKKDPSSGAVYIITQNETGFDLKAAQAHSQEESACFQAHVWSNPEGTYTTTEGTFPTGNPLDHKYSTDNRRSLNNTAWTVSAFRPMVVCYTKDSCLLQQRMTRGGANESGDQFGYALATGDFNGDGFDDAVIGAPFEWPGSETPNSPGMTSGAVFVFEGSNLGLIRGRGYTQEFGEGLGTNENGDLFGASFAVGDFNRDGFDDLAVGTPGETPGDDPRSGGVKVFRGSSEGLQALQMLNQEAGGLGANEKGDEFGHSLVSGDFNGDGYDDLAVGAPGESPGDDEESGGVKVFTGSASGLVGWCTLNQDSGGLGMNEKADLFGWALAAADFNKDGFSDLIVGAPGESPGEDPESGAIYVFFGGSSELDPRKAVTQETDSGMGTNDNKDEFGYALATGDFDGDGYPDLAVGTPGEKPGDDPRSGGVKVFRGPGLLGWCTLNQESTDMGINESGDLFGYALSAGDLNGDGRWDLAVGAPGESPGSDPKSGGVTVYLGGSDCLEPLQSVTQSYGDVDQNEKDDFFAKALAMGDFDGDGVPELLVGAPGESPGSDPQSGAAYVFRIWF